MKQFVTRAYNRFSFDPLRSTITKRSKETRLSDETNFYKGVPEQLSIHFPRMVSSGQDPKSNEYFLELEYYPYDNLGRYLVGDKTLTKEQWVSVAKALCSVLQRFSEVKSPDPLYKWDFQSMYYIKTDREYRKLVTQFETFKEIHKLPKLVINDVSYDNFETIWKLLKNRFDSILTADDFLPCVTHGDCCFSNILLGSPTEVAPILRFVDPRGVFGSRKVFGDPYYDLAKLMHSTDVGYEYFIYDKFEVSEGVVPGSYNLTYANTDKDEVHKIFQEHLYSKFDQKKIKLIQGLIYIGMCARHYDSPKRQLAMYLSGVKVLNEVLREE